MTAHTQDDYDKALARFCHFYDGVIRTIVVRFQEGGKRHIELHVATRDSETDENEGWVCVRVVVRDVTEFAVRDSSRTPIQVLSDGIHILCVEDRVGVEFGGAHEPFESFESFRSSYAFAIGGDVHFQVKPY